MTESTAKYTLAPLVLRLGLAVIFVFHGSGKVTQKYGWGTQWMNQIPNQTPPPAAVQAAVAWGEFAAGLAMSIGLLARVASLGLIAIMAGAIYMVHGKNGFDMQNNGYEYHFAIIVMCLAIFLLGAGPLSLDRYILLRRQRALAGSSSSAS